MIPDASYATVYDETITYFKQTGALDPSTSGAVSNVGLMAQKAEEYGSHPTTFEAAADGSIRYVLHNGETLHEHKVQKGDIIIIIAYASLTLEEAKTFKARIVFPNEVTNLIR